MSQRIFPLHFYFSTLALVYGFCTRACASTCRFLTSSAAELRKEYEYKLSPNSDGKEPKSNARRKFFARKKQDNPLPLRLCQRVTVNMETWHDVKHGHVNLATDAAELRPPAASSWSFSPATAPIFHKLASWGGEERGAGPLHSFFISCFSSSSPPPCLHGG